MTAPARPPIVPSSSYRQTKIDQPSDTRQESVERSDVNSLWNFADSSRGNEDGVFFYGAPGQFQEVEQSFPSYSRVAKLHVYPDKATETDASFNIHKPAEVCRFFLLGNCKFGSYCKYLHTQSEVTISSSETGEDPPIECGICIEAPKTSMYGILSHCDCKFCLECIRNWRKEGLTIAKKADQVRLCPLCRIESYFVIPSGRLLTGDEKEVLLLTYKESLAKKPCKYFSNGEGECPFGTSCFYMHDVDGGKAKGYRKLFKSEDEIVSLSSMRLADYF